MARTPRRIDNVDIRYEINVEPVREALERIRADARLRLADAMREEIERDIFTGAPRQEEPARLYHADPVPQATGWDIALARDQIAQAFAVPRHLLGEPRRRERRGRSRTVHPDFFRVVRRAAQGSEQARADLIRWSDGRDRLSIVFDLLDVVREIVSDSDRMRAFFEREQRMVPARAAAPDLPPATVARAPKGGRGIKLPARTEGAGDE